MIQVISSQSRDKIFLSGKYNGLYFTIVYIIIIFIYLTFIIYITGTVIYTAVFLVNKNYCGPTFY